jgi:hypothetical protein
MFAAFGISVFYLESNGTCRKSVLGIECMFQFSLELIQNIFHSDKFLAVRTESPVGLCIKCVLFLCASDQNLNILTNLSRIYNIKCHDCPFSSSLFKYKHGKGNGCIFVTFLL